MQLEEFRRKKAEKAAAIAAAAEANLTTSVPADDAIVSALAVKAASPNIILNDGPGGEPAKTTTAEPPSSFVPQHSTKPSDAHPASPSGRHSPRSSPSEIKGNLTPRIRDASSGTVRVSVINIGCFDMFKAFFLMLLLFILKRPEQAASVAHRFATLSMILKPLDNSIAASSAV